MSKLITPTTISEGKLRLKSVRLSLQSNSPIEAETNMTNFHFRLLYNFFNLSYYFWTIPFRFNLTSTTDGEEKAQPITLKSSRIRKLYGILLWIFSLIIHSHYQHSRITLVENRLQLLFYFNIVHTVFHAMSFLQFGANLLLRPDSYLKIIVAVERCQLLHQPSKLNGKQWHACLTSVLVLISLCGLPSLFILLTMELNDWSVSKMLRWNLNSSSPYASSLWSHWARTAHSNNSEIYWLQADEEWTFAEVSFGFIPPLMWVPYWFIEAFRITAYVLHGLMFHAAVNNFVTHVTSSKVDCERNPNRKAHLLERYRDLKELSDSINDVWGWTFFIALVDYILWFTTDLNSDLQEHVWTGRLILVWYCLGMLVLLFYGAEASRKMSGFKAWMVTHGSEVFKANREEQASFLAGLEFDGVWIGKHGLYTLNYAFLGQVVILLVTLFIITLQYELSSQQ